MSIQNNIENNKWHEYESEYQEYLENTNQTEGKCSYDQWIDKIIICNCNKCESYREYYLSIAIKCGCFHNYCSQCSKAKEIHNVIHYDEWCPCGCGCGTDACATELLF